VPFGTGPWVWYPVVDPGLVCTTVISLAISTLALATASVNAPL